MPTRGGGDRRTGRKWALPVGRMAGEERVEAGTDHGHDHGEPGRENGRRGAGAAGGARAEGPRPATPPASAPEGCTAGGQEVVVVEVPRVAEVLLHEDGAPAAAPEAVVAPRRSPPARRSSPRLRE